MGETNKIELKYCRGENMGCMGQITKNKINGNRLKCPEKGKDGQDGFKYLTILFHLIEYAIELGRY